MALMQTIIARAMLFREDHRPRYSGCMRASPFADLRRGAEFLWRHPGWSLGLALLGTLLAALAPFLQIRTGLPDNLPVQAALAFAVVLPLDMYFLPRFLLAIDAEALNHPQNPKHEWRTTFESRWLRAIGAKAMLYLVVFAGSLCFILPGLVFMALYGWSPWRVLLRGESLRDSVRGSVLFMARWWLPVVLTVCTFMAVYLLLSMATVTLLARSLPQPTPWQRLTHPSIWVINFLIQGYSLWVSASILALYHRLEAGEPASVPDRTN